MVEQGQLLRYKISSWRQLPQCLSNNSRHLRIHVVDLFNNDTLRGFKISLEHEQFGIIFACVIHARGDIVSDESSYGKFDLSTEVILKELEKYGYLITYEPNKNLSSSQLEYLMTLKGLGYDKIRILNVWTAPDGAKNFSPKVVAFQSNPLGDWLNNAYAPPESEFLKALLDGTAVNLTNMSKTRNYRWDWLKDFVANVDDIIEDNADQMIEISDPDEEEE